MISNHSALPVKYTLQVQLSQCLAKHHTHAMKMYGMEISSTHS